MLAARNRLKRNSDFIRVLRQGRRRTLQIRGQRLELCVKDGATSQSRFGFVTRRTVGSAPRRNRWRRRLRAAAHEFLRANPEQPPLDVVVRVFPRRQRENIKSADDKIREASFPLLLSQFEKTLLALARESTSREQGRKPAAAKLLEGNGSANQPRQRSRNRFTSSTKDRTGENRTR